MSIKSFCKSAGFHENVYYYWQRKLREAACTELARRDFESDKSLTPNGWARLEPQGRSPAESGVIIEVGGCRVTATASTDPALLAQVCRMLKSI